LKGYRKPRGVPDNHSSRSNSSKASEAETAAYAREHSGSSGSSSSNSTIASPFGQISGMHHAGGNEYGGTHHSVYGEGAHFSWDTDAHGSYVEGSAHSTIHEE
jgi:hypothetical protein